MTLAKKMYQNGNHSLRLSTSSDELVFDVHTDESKVLTFVIEEKDFETPVKDLWDEIMGTLIAKVMWNSLK